MPIINPLTLERATAAIFGDPSHPDTLRSFERNESARRAALARAALALSSIEELGLHCGAFGSALRPGDFFHQSDVDLAAWTEELAPIDSGRALAARLACHHAFGAQHFDLVLLPCANEPFARRIVTKWARGRSEVERASRGKPLASPVVFGPEDVAFIDSDRLDIASRAAARMSKNASDMTSMDNPQRTALSLCASLQTIVRVAEKCAKDALREFAQIRPSFGDSRPLYPLLAYPSSALGGIRMANEASLALYFECVEMLSPPDAIDRAWCLRMALAADAFCTAMRTAFMPALAAMGDNPPRGAQHA